MADVLIVDDDEDIRASVRAILEDLGGYTVYEAPDGAAALAILQTSQQSFVVLLDLLMPGMDGIDVLEAVAADETLATRHSYVLVTVSRRAVSKDFPSTLKLAVPIVPKPYDLDTLLTVVAEANARIGGASD